MPRRLLPWFGIVLAIVVAVVLIPLVISYLLVTGPSRQAAIYDLDLNASRPVAVLSLESLAVVAFILLRFTSGPPALSPTGA